ncbi:hypothetical protein BD626DRAFT_448797 [Schizophyllum amplum]|uniref:F-box domain-containing protein n=1 Tax=Schizophyllum amplum TaxID=97359 RepID=A0A550CZU0_9AGAR|nr:hypothetical protein BD626DRAFT_448797 [Auriculariopsis ampla]
MDTELLNPASLCLKCLHSFKSDLDDFSDLKSRARSSYVPSTLAETDRLQSRLSQVQHSISKCDQEILLLESAVRSLRQHRRANEKVETNLKALLAPIRKIPVEILAHIATYTLPNRWFKNMIGVHAWTFTQVCHSWREVTIAMRWPWARVMIPCRTATCSMSGEVIDEPGDRQFEAGLMDMFSTYMQRSGHHPLTIQTLSDSKSWESDWENSSQPIWTEVWKHADRLRALEVRCSDEGFPFPSNSLSVLQRLTIHGYMGGTLRVNAPNLCVLDLNDTKMTDVTNVRWTNLRALEVHGFDEFWGDDYEALRYCMRLEVLSLTDDVANIHDDWEPIHLPALRTLDIGRAMITICPHIDAPSLKNFVLNIPYSGDFRMHDDDIPLLASLLLPVTSLTLRNMCDYHTDLLQCIISIPRCLERLHMRQETFLPPPAVSLQAVHRGLCVELVKSNALAPHLVDIGFINGAKNIRWESEDIALVRGLLESRGIAATDGGAVLARLAIWTPFADFPAPCEGWISAYGREGRQRLEITRCQGVIVEPLEISSFL